MLAGVLAAKATSISAFSAIVVNNEKQDRVAAEVNARARHGGSPGLFALGRYQGSAGDQSGFV